MNTKTASISKKHLAHVERNIRAHNKIAKRYERIHGEIYNEVEQLRLNNALARALSCVDPQEGPLLALDFGCGAGNLTQKLTNLGCNVLACDVSAGFLDLVGSRQYPTTVSTILIDGGDLARIDDASVDMVATYSVLHHVPDYLGVLREFLRVLKPGGVIFIDHELSAEYWEPKPELTEFYRLMSLGRRDNYQKYFRLSNYANWFIWKFINPRYRSEGDIHVFKDDHIEWGEIATTLASCGADIVFDEDYLLYKRGYDLSVFNSYKLKESDMRLMVAKKRVRIGDVNV